MQIDGTEGSYILALRVQGDPLWIPRNPSGARGQGAQKISMGYPQGPGESPQVPMEPLRASGIVAKKRDPELFLAQIRKVEARLGKLAKIRKSVIN